MAKVVTGTFTFIAAVLSSNDSPLHKLIPALYSVTHLRLFRYPLTTLGCCIVARTVQELSIPMWRRSLGGRAHPLAPSLAVVLSKLTGLTSLAVDGKFGHLTVVSCLTNLRRLASAAPLSTEGWKVGKYSGKKRKQNISALFKTSTIM